MTDKEFKMKRFNLSKISDEAVVAFIGKRKSGKSYCLRDLLHANMDIPAGIVISPTEAPNPFFADFLPEYSIMPEFNRNIIKKVLDRQKQIIAISKERDNVDPRAFIVLDDCLADNAWTKTSEIRALFMNGRHYRIFFILTMQYPLGIPPNLRTNIDYSIIFKDPNVNNRKRIYENFAGLFKTFEIFCECMDALDKHECIIVDNNGDGNWQDNVYWYKAKNHENFKVGDRQFWNMQNRGDKHDTYDKKDRVKIIKEGY